MKSESVTKAWEFYRDNCQGFKEPMRKEFRRLDGYVASLESENAKLRELVRDMRLFILLASATAGVSILAHGKPTLGMEAFERRMRELGVEVDA